jgi:hypothetical protein
MLHTKCNQTSFWVLLQSMEAVLRRNVSLEYASSNNSDIAWDMTGSRAISIKIRYRLWKHKWWKQTMISNVSVLINKTLKCVPVLSIFENSMYIQGRHVYRNVLFEISVRHLHMAIFINSMMLLCLVRMRIHWLKYLNTTENLRLHF